LAGETGAEIGYEIDTSYKHYWYDWYQEQHWIECTNVGQSVQSMIGVYLFVNAILGFYIGWIPDYYGRKKTLIVSLSMSLAFQVTYAFWHNHAVRWILFACFAMCNVKNGCSYVWAFEIAGPKYKAFVTTFINVWDRSTFTILGIFGTFVSRYWLHVVFFYFCLGCLSLLTIVFLVPESPTWLMNNNRRM
jgi:MFS family permease